MQLAMDTAETRARDQDLVSLVELVATGDQSALATLYDATNRLIYSLILRVLGDVSSAEEVLVDVYTRSGARRRVTTPTAARLWPGWRPSRAAAPLTACVRVGRTSGERNRSTSWATPRRTRPAPKSRPQLPNAKGSSGRP